MSHIRTKPATDQYRVNYDKVFPPKKETAKEKLERLEAENSRLFAENHQRRFGARP